MSEHLSTPAQDVIMNWANDTVTDLITALQVDHAEHGHDHAVLVERLRQMQREDGDLVVRLYDTVVRYLNGMEV